MQDKQRVNRQIPRQAFMCFPFAPLVRVNNVAVTPRHFLNHLDGLVAAVMVSAPNGAFTSPALPALPSSLSKLPHLPHPDLLFVAIRVPSNLSRNSRTAAAILTVHASDVKLKPRSHSRKASSFPILQTAQPTSSSRKSTAWLGPLLFFPFLEELKLARHPPKWQPRSTYPSKSRFLVGNTCPLLLVSPS